MPNYDPLASLATALMRAVVNSGCIRGEQDIDVACKIMREEVKAFLTADRYADERELSKTGRQGLAMMSLVAECISRTLAERD